MNKVNQQKDTEDAKHLFDLLDRYLIADLEMMVNGIPAKPSGGLGYPAIQTIISGMELLGMLMSGKKNDEAFRFFWDNYLKKSYPEYNNDHLRKIFRNCIRNGTAHYFLVKPKILITKKGKNHLKISNNSLIIDLKILYKHFKNIYKQLKDKITNAKDPKMLNNLSQSFKCLKNNWEVETSEVDVYIQSINREYHQNFDKFIEGSSASETTVEGVSATKFLKNTQKNSW